MLPIIIGGIIVAIPAVLVIRSLFAIKPSVSVTSDISKAVKLPLIPHTEKDLIPVTLRGETWLVTREPIGPVGIGEGLDIARSLGMQLPTSDLVDAIWNQADLKIDPPIRSHDGTPKTMSTPEVFEKQRVRIEELIANRPYKLLAGTFKDVVTLPSGKTGLYGWNVEGGATFTKRTGVPTHAVRGASGVKVEGGRVIQQEFGGHGLDWKDYSQGVRPVKRIA